MEQRKLSIIKLAALAVALAAGFVFMVMGIDTPSEGLLLLLALISIAAAWTASRYYSEWGFRNTLRTLASRNVEKVNDLSNELDRLTVYLQQELEAADYQSPDQELMAKEMRIEGALLTIQTLQSFNERSLDGWENLIRREINVRQEERWERAEGLRDIIRRIKALAPTHADDLLDAQSRDASAPIRRAASGGSQVRLVASIGVSLRLPRTQAISEGMVLPLCPSCGNTVRYRQKEKVGPVRWVQCPSCDTKRTSKHDGQSFKLDVRRVVAEAIGCPMCGTQSTVELGNWLGSVANTACAGCGLQMSVSRTVSASDVEPANRADVVEFESSDELLETVRRAMPPQPWPKGTSRRIANELGLAHTQVNRIISELMRRGTFGPQIDGRVCELVQEQEASAAKPTDQ